MHHYSSSSNSVLFSERSQYFTSELIFYRSLLPTRINFQHRNRLQNGTFRTAFCYTSYDQPVVALSSLQIVLLFTRVSLTLQFPLQLQLFSSTLRKSDQRHYMHCSCIQSQTFRHAFNLHLISAIPAHHQAQESVLSVSHLAL